MISYPELILAIIYIVIFILIGLLLLIKKSSLIPEGGQEELAKEREFSH